MRKGSHHTKEIRYKLSEACKGRIPWNKGKTGVYSKEALIKMSKAQKGNTKRRGSHHTEEAKRKMSEAKKDRVSGNKGKHWQLTKETKYKMSKARKGNQSALGCHHSAEMNKRKSEREKGAGNPNWKGGMSFEPYPLAWTRELRQAIRQRDKFACQLCGEYPAFDVHHIDYDKENCAPENLVTLCRSCHSKTNRNRNYWTELLGNRNG